MGATMTWLGHATFRLTLPDERVILIDPWLQSNPSCPQELQKPARCDMIFLTHGSIRITHLGNFVSGIGKSLSRAFIEHIRLLPPERRIQSVQTN